MRPFATAWILLALVVTSCQAGGLPASRMGECPPPPPADLGPQSSGGEELMDDIAAETTRFGQDLVGMSSEQAEACALEAGYTWRVYERDGEPFALTMDYRVTRINVKIERGVVTDAYSG